MTTELRDPKVGLEQIRPVGRRLRPFDESGAFVAVVENKDVRVLAIRGAGATTLAQVFSVATQIISTLILARLLMPSDFGLVTMVTTFSLLLMNFGGNGFTEAVIQRKELDQSLTSNLFWINAASGTVLTIGFAAAGSLLARFYGNPRVVPVTIGISLTVLFTSLSIFHVALLMRAMRFPLVYANQIVARTISLVITIVLAWAKLGYWALVAGAVAQPLCECTGAWILCRWIPSRPRRIPGTGSIVAFALQVYGRFSFNYFARNTDNLLIGWRFNAEALGFYKKAYDLFLFTDILRAFSPVAVAALSRLRHDAEKYKQHLLSALSVWAFLGFGIGGAFTLVGKDVIRVVLGPKWEPAGQIFVFFGPGIGMMFVYGIHGWIHVSLGKPRRWLQWGVFEFVVTVLSFVIALPWGPAGVATAWSISLLILTVPALYYAGQPINLGFAPIVTAIWKFFVASLLAACATALIVTHAGLNVPSDLIATMVEGVKVFVLFTGLYLVTVIILHGSCKPIYRVLGLLREVAMRDKSPQTSAAA